MEYNFRHDIVGAIGIIVALYFILLIPCMHIKNIQTVNQIISGNK